MIVVSDTSPLNYLVLIEAVEVLPAIFEDVYVPNAVLRELRESRAPEVVRRWANTPPSWLKIRDPRLGVASARELDPGEEQAIALAKELQASAVLMDERKGRAVVEREGLLPIGTVAVLELAAQKDLLQLPAALEALRRTTFRISSEYIDEALKRDAARRGR